MLENFKFHIFHRGTLKLISMSSTQNITNEIDMKTHELKSLTDNHWTQPLVSFENLKIRLNDLVNNRMTDSTSCYSRPKGYDGEGGSNVNRCGQQKDCVTLFTQCTKPRKLFQLFRDNITHRTAFDCTFISPRIIYVAVIAIPTITESKLQREKHVAAKPH